jgi:hypothetical protein
MKSILKSLDKFQIIGFLISIGISISLLLAKQDTFGSISLGLLLAIFTQLFDMQIRQDETEKRLLDAGTLNKELYKNEWLLAQLQSIVSDYVAIKGNWYWQFHRKADELLNQSRNILRNMAEGKLIAELDSPYVIGAEEYQRAEVSIDATSAADISYWRTPHARDYIKAHEEAIKRGVKIRRIFIQQITKLQEYKSILERLEQIGVDVFIVEPESLSLNLYEDLLIMDNKIYARLELAANGQATQEVVSINITEVENARYKYESILRQSQKMKDVLKD